LYHVIRHGYTPFISYKESKYNKRFPLCRKVQKSVTYTQVQCPEGLKFTLYDSYKNSAKV